MGSKQGGWAVALCLALIAGVASAQEGSTITLGVGTQKVITVPGVSRLSIGDPAVADVKSLGGNQILIIGQGEGKTTLIVWKGSGARVSYLVAVRRQDPNE